MKRGLAALTIGGVGVLLLGGAHCVGVKRPYPAPKAEHVAAALEKRAGAVASLRAETRMSHRTRQGKIKATVRMMMKRGGSLRCDVVSPFDTPLATLVAAKGHFALIDAQTNQHFHGPASPCNLARMLQVEMSPDDVFTALIGGTPLIKYDKASLAWDDRAAAEVLTLESATYTQKITVSGDKRWDLISSEVRARKTNALVLRLTPTMFRTVSGLRLPERIRAEQPQLGKVLELEFRVEEVNLKLPGPAFELPAAGGLPSHRVDCPSRPSSGKTAG